MEICSFAVFVAFLCAPCYTTCLSLFFCNKTSVNAQPLSPPIFEKIASRFQQQRFFLFCILTSTFFIFSSICVDFRLPLPPSLGQLGPICDRFGFHFCSVLLEVGERRRRKRQDPRGQTKKNTHTHNPTI